MIKKAQEEMKRKKRNKTIIAEQMIEDKKPHQLSKYKNDLKGLFQIQKTIE